ncbi:hypothetical protein [Microcoleus sp. bin38.metabat.b11b12b14.051]|uniref:hypothetical protein n=1 Tax=Microcoleus sp. bin38.metabat.b11b12b14.051 TaxID=2742709 RepID=UPI0025EF6D44|nr:hypothetical protein [Microcoleus sp. bin38.metabat.b11b12b14.051]
MDRQLRAIFVNSKLKTFSHQTCTQRGKIRLILYNVYGGAPRLRSRVGTIALTKKQDRDARSAGD